MQIKGIPELLQELAKQGKELWKDLYNLAKTLMALMIQNRIIGIILVIVLLVPIVLWAARPVIGRREKKRKRKKAI